jgi:DNA-binding CsgD family transcriptional regulator/PAS domain-containing protein
MPEDYGDAVAGIFAAVLDERRAPAAIKAVAGHVGASGAAYVLVNKLTRQVSTVAWWGSFTGSRADYLAHYSHIDPFRVIQEEARCGTFLRLSERLPQGILRHNEWYNDFVLKGGVGDVLSTKLHENPSHMVIIGLHQAIDDTRPVPRNMAALEMLMSPLRKAARLHLDLIGVGYRSAITRAGASQLVAGVIFTHSNGRIVEANQAGERLLRVGDGLVMRNGQLHAGRNSETTKLAYLIARAANSGTAGSMRISRGDGRPPHVARVVRVNAELAGYDLPMVMILVSVPEENRVSEPELAELYGLTPAESRIAMGLARGKRTTDLAAEFGVQITTLRSQLSSILKKCGVEKQADLIRLILNTPDLSRLS